VVPQGLARAIARAVSTAATVAVAAVHERVDTVEMRGCCATVVAMLALAAGTAPALAQDALDPTEPETDEPSADTPAEPVAEEPPAEPSAEPSAEEPPPPAPEPAIPLIDTGYGSLRLGLVLQAGYEFLPDARQGDRNSFDLHHARLILDGHLMSENLRYLFSGDATEGLAGDRRPGAPGGEMDTDRYNVDVPFLLDAKLSWVIPAIGTTISAGRFVPSWGILMQTRPSRLGAINYPLYLYGGEGAIGRFRNVGLDVQIRVIDFLAFEAGIFNGGRNSWGDDNDAKDVIAAILIEPVAGMQIRAASFFAFPRTIDAIRRDGTPIEHGTETHIQPVIEARYQDYGFDVMLGGAASFVERHADDTRDDFYSMGGMAHLGYTLIGDWFQLFARGELWDPNVGHRGDDQIRLTAGPQLFLEGIHSQIRINYIYDRYRSAAAMCRNYLGVPGCAGTGDVTEAKRNANTVMLQVGVDI
jgi:hypothetical protein